MTDTTDHDAQVPSVYAGRYTLNDRHLYCNDCGTPYLPDTAITIFTGTPTQNELLGHLHMHEIAHAGTAIQQHTNIANMTGGKDQDRWFEIEEEITESCSRNHPSMDMICGEKHIRVVRRKIRTVPDTSATPTPTSIDPHMGILAPSTAERRATHFAERAHRAETTLERITALEVHDGEYIDATELYTILGRPIPPPTDHATRIRDRHQPD